MRTIAQLAIVAVLGVSGFGAWQYWQNHQSGPANASPGGRQATPPPLQVEVMPVKAGTVFEKAEAVGTARANESIVVTAKMAGNVAVIGFEEGQLVKAGQILVELETRERKAELDQARSELEQARAVRDDARQKLDRGRQLVSTGALTKARLDELDQTLRQTEARVRAAEARMRAVDARLDDVRITAPFDGRVGLRRVSIGALLQPGTEITTLDDISRIKLDFAVPENFLEKLRPGLPTFARSNAFPGRVFEGRVTVVDSRVDPVTRSVRVNATFDNVGETLKPGLFLSIELALSQRDNALIVPEEALVPEGGQQYVFVVRDNRAMRVRVAVGARLQGEVEITDGVKLGDTVIVRGTSRVRPNQPVQPRPLQAVPAS